MDNGRFDDLTRLLGAGVSRRGMIKGIVATLIGSGTVVAGRALPVSAQCAGDVCTSTLDCCPGHLCIGNECVECLDFGEGCSISGTPCCDPTLECGFDYDQRINVCRVPCVDDGQDCSSGLECCQNDNYCTSFNLCQSCIEEGNQFCQEDTDCCTGLVCASSTCSTPCVGGRSCTTDGDCCAEGETCVSGTCAVACRELGFPCATADQCCSQACSEGSCCSGLGGACPGGSGCCGTASCENDVCCSAEGRACGGNQDCCSGLDCDDSNTCVPPCVPVGEGCSQTSECCNLAGSLAVQCLGAICTVCIPTGDSSTVCPTDDDDDEAVAVGCCDPNAIYDEAICSCVLRTCIERGEECGQLDCCDSEVPYLTGFCDPGNVCEFCRPTGVAPVVCEPVTGQLEPCCDRNAVYNETVCACEVVTCTPIGSACAEDDDDDCCGELSECENGACCNNQGGACNDDPDCCFRRYCDDQSQTCVFCSSPGGACDRDAVCCSGSCVDDVCVCRLDGTCRSDADCCVGSYCSGGQCVQCLPDGEGIYCATDQACCSGNCDNSNCGCRSLQTNCESAEQCCSGYCIDGRCAEEAGCAPLGEACQEPQDCCGFGDAGLTYSCEEGICEACIQTTDYPVGVCVASEEQSLPCCDPEAEWNPSTCRCEIPVCVETGNKCEDHEDCCGEDLCIDGWCKLPEECAGNHDVCDAYTSCCKGYACVDGRCISRKHPKPEHPEKPNSPGDPTGGIDTLPNTGAGDASAESAWIEAALAGGAAAAAAAWLMSAVSDPEKRSPASPEPSPVVSPREE